MEDAVAATIRFDFNNAIAQGRAGADLVGVDELAALEAVVRQYHAQLLAEKEAGRLGFAELPWQPETADACRRSAEEKKGRFDNFVVLGIGGSALGPIAVHNALRHPCYNLDARFRNGRPRFFVEDNIDPERMQSLIDLLDVRRTLFNVISKSGGTAETMAQFLIVREMLRGALGKDFAKNMVVTTDAKKGLMRELAALDGYEAFPIPANVGGRFSELTPVGLFPAAMAGIDGAAMLAGARAMAQRCACDDLWKNPAYMAAAISFLADVRKGKHISVMMPYSSALRDIADWYRQLWAESLGKKHDLAGAVVHTGQTPVKALGVTDQHSQVQLYVEGPNDKLFTFIAVGKHRRDITIPKAFDDKEGAAYLGGHTLGGLFDAERAGTQYALTQAGRPNLTITLPRVDEESLGALLYMFELQTAMAGKLYRIDAFDQPGVEAGKIAAYALMGRTGFEAERAKIEAASKQGRGTFVME